MTSGEGLPSDQWAPNKLEGRGSHDFTNNGDTGAVQSPLDIWSQAGSNLLRFVKKNHKE